MSWLYRLLKRNADSTLITVDDSVTSGISVPALTVVGTTTQTGVATFTAAPVISNTPRITGVAGVAGAAGASPWFYKVATLGAGSTLIDWWVGYSAPSAVGPTPAHIGDILVTNLAGKMYIASGITAYTDWKLVTSA